MIVFPNEELAHSQHQKMQIQAAVRTEENKLRLTDYSLKQLNSLIGMELNQAAASIDSLRSLTCPEEFATFHKAVNLCRLQSIPQPELCHH